MALGVLQCCEMFDPVLKLQEQAALCFLECIYHPLFCTAGYGRLTAYCCGEGCRGGRYEVPRKGCISGWLFVGCFLRM